MSWWEILLVVVFGIWILGVVFLTLNHIVRHRRSYDNIPPILTSIYDSCWWPIYTAFYGIDGLRREVTGNP